MFFFSLISSYIRVLFLELQLYILRRNLWIRE
nr:MAG TPA: hypothetical protein [Caudoviricetes sp.]